MPPTPRSATCARMPSRRTARTTCRAKSVSPSPISRGPPSPSPGAFASRLKRRRRNGRSQQPDRLDGRCRRLEREQVVLPRRRPRELIVHQGTRHVDVGFLAVPSRSSTNHVVPLPVPSFFNPTRRRRSTGSPHAGDRELPRRQRFRAGAGVVGRAALPVRPLTMRCRTGPSWPACAPKARRGADRQETRTRAETTPP